MKDMLVSVIVASYNYEKYLKETLDSVLRQSYSDFEVIVVDDGSKDNSVAIIEEYVKQDSRVKFYQHDGFVNKGLVETIKLALSKVKGKWIAFCETDDYWREDYLQRKTDRIKKDPSAVWVANNVEMFGDNRNVLIKDKLAAEFARLLRYENKKNAFGDLYHNNLIPTFSAMMVRKDVLVGCDFNSPVDMWIDWWLWRQISFVYPLSFVDEKLTYWRLHSDSYNANKASIKIDCKNFIKQNTKLLKVRYGVEYNKRMVELFFNFVVRKIKKKLKVFTFKEEYLRIRFLGIEVFKIKYEKQA